MLNENFENLIVKCIDGVTYRFSDCTVTIHPSLVLWVTLGPKDHVFNPGNWLHIEGNHKAR